MSSQRTYRKQRGMLQQSSSPAYYWSDPAAIAANQHYTITPAQEALLKKELHLWPAGLLGMVTFLTFTPIILLVTLNNQPALFLLYLVTFGAPLLALFLAYSKRSTLLDPARRGEIMQEQGEVVWQEQRYIMRTPTRQLRTPGNTGLPAPGPHSFYYLATSGFLLSAAPITTSTGMIAYPGTLSASGLPGSEQARQALQQALAQALDFTWEDLECNRQRRLSPRQSRKLHRKLTWGLIGRIAGLLVGAALLFGAYKAFTTQSTNSGVGYFFALFGGWVALTSLYSLTFGARKRSRAIQQADIAVYTGLIQPRKIEGGDDSPNAYYYDFASTSLEVSSNACNALIPRTNYRLFYLRHMETVLSIEPLEAPPR